MACGVPSVLFFGSVDPALRYPYRKNLTVIQNECVHAGCYHSVIGVRGTDCVIFKKRPPCSDHTTNKVVDTLRPILNDLKTKDYAGTVHE
jgi:hypothetical protein